MYVCSTGAPVALGSCCVCLLEHVLDPQLDHWRLWFQIVVL